MFDESFMKPPLDQPITPAFENNVIDESRNDEVNDISQIEAEHEYATEDVAKQSANFQAHLISFEEEEKTKDDQ